MQRRSVAIGLAVTIGIVAAVAMLASDLVPLATVPPSIAPVSPAELLGATAGGLDPAAGQRDQTAADQPAARAAVPTLASWPVSVQVVDSLDEPVIGATIELAATIDGEPFAQYRSGARGVWRGTAAGERVWLRASSPCIGRSIWLDTWPELAAERLTVLMLVRTVTVRGQVFDANLRALPHAAITIGGKPNGAAVAVGPFVPRGPLHADAAGRFSFDAAAGVSVQLAIDGEPETRTDVVAVDGAEVVLVPMGAFRVTVRILGIDGAPVPAAVDIDSSSGGRNARAPARRRAFDFDPDVDPELWRLLNSGDPSLPTYGGRAPLPRSEPEPRHSEFTFEVTPGHVHRLWVTAEGHAPCVVATRALGIKEPRQDLEVRLVPTVITRGRVRSAEALRWLECVPASNGTDGPQHLEFHSESLARDATFAVPLPVGTTWQLALPNCRPVTCRAGDQDVRVTDDPVPEPLEPPAPPAPRTVLVLATDAEDRPANKVQLRWLRFVDDEHSLHAVDHESFGNGQLVRLPAEAVLPQRLLVTDSATQASAWIDLDGAAKEVAVGLQPPATVVVALRCGGQPARGVQIVIEPCGWVRSERLSNSDGRWQCVVPHGPARLRVLRFGDELVRREVVLPPGQRSEFVFELSL